MHECQCCAVCGNCQQAPDNDCPHTKVVGDDSVKVVGFFHAAMKLVHSGKDIVLGQSSQIAHMNLFPLKVATQRGNTKLGRFDQSVKGLC